MNLSYKGVWGYHPLVVSLANTGEPLFIVNRPGNRPSQGRRLIYRLLAWRPDLPIFFRLLDAL